MLLCFQASVGGRCRSRFEPAIVKVRQLGNLPCYYVTNCQLSNNMEQSPSWEADRHAVIYLMLLWISPVSLYSVVQINCGKPYFLLFCFVLFIKKYVELFEYIIIIKLGLQIFVLEIQQCQWKWLQHLERMDVNRISKQTMSNNLLCRHISHAAQGSSCVIVYIVLLCFPAMTLHVYCCYGALLWHYIYNVAVRSCHGFVQGGPK